MFSKVSRTFILYFGVSFTTINGYNIELKIIGNYGFVK
jgi:hypothetical protein